MTKLSPDDLVKLANDTGERYVRDRKAGRVVTVDPNNARREIIRTEEQWWEGIVTAASIMLAESGGDTAARCYNVDGPDGRPTCSPTGPAGPRGVDRGLWQWNSVAWGPKRPDGTANPAAISDADADNPERATEIAYRVSQGFTTWGPWTGSRGLDPASPASRTIRNTTAAKALQVRTLPPNVDPGTRILQTVADPIIGAASNVLSWTEGLAKLLGALTSAAFWRRVGIGALGLALIVAALVWLGRDTLASTALSTATGVRTR